VILREQGSGCGKGVKVTWCSVEGMVDGSINTAQA